MSKRDGGLQDVQGIKGWKAPTVCCHASFPL
jgi:hypothetical protein